MKTSDHVDKIFAALSKFQGSITSPPKNKTVEVKHRDGPGRHSFVYAELATILDHTRKQFVECELSWSSSVGSLGDSIILFSRLCHSSGQWIETQYPLPDVSDPKIFGGEITYGRRYSFTMLTGIASDDDADNAPTIKNPLKSKVANPTTPAPSSKPPVVAPKPAQAKSAPQSKPQVNMSDKIDWQATQEDVQELKIAARENEWPFDIVTEYMTKAFNKERVGALTKSEFIALTGVIKTMKYTVALHDLAELHAPQPWLDSLNEKS